MEVNQLVGAKIDCVDECVGIGDRKEPQKYLEMGIWVYDSDDDNENEKIRT